MSARLYMGNEVMALAAINAGVNVVCGYPGTPSTEVLETVAKNNRGNIYVEWSANEKVAMEVAGGAAFGGARALVTMKQMGLNVAADPLMCLSYLGVKGGMVVLVADDPGPISSQTEQDTRSFARFANLPVFDPTDAVCAYRMMLEAFELSERLSLPVLFRPTTRVCHSAVSMDITVKTERKSPSGFEKDGRFAIFPSLSLKNHFALEQKQQDVGDMFSKSPFNTVTGTGRKGIAVSGVCAAHVTEALRELGGEARVLTLGCPYPTPKALIAGFLADVDSVLCVEELDAFVEQSLNEVAGERSLSVEITGKQTGALPVAGEYTYEVITAALAKYLGIDYTTPESAELPALPGRPPVLCAGCPHRASFYAVKQAFKGRPAIFTGDIGCYTLGNTMDMVDTCVCMGAGLTVAQGLSRVDGSKCVAFIGDSTFFHSGLTGIANAAYNNADILVIVLDNSTTAMTGHQPHPGTGLTMMGDAAHMPDIEKILLALGAKRVLTVDPLDQDAAIAAVKEAGEYKGLAAVIMRSPCIALFEKPGTYNVDERTCVGCKKCIRDTGCPAIALKEGKANIVPSTCYGCGLCAGVCPTGAIGGGK